MQRIVVVGPGALGCLFAGLLSRIAEVWLLDHDPARAERILNQGGIFCEGLATWNAKVPVTANTADIGTADLVILCTKSFHTGEALMHVRPVIGEHTAVLSVQNGIGNVEFIEKMVGPQRAFAGVTHQAAVLLSEGKIRQAFDGPTIIGCLSRETSTDISKIKKLFTKAGISIKVSENISGLLWSKLIMSVGINALSAITRLENGYLLANAETKELIKAAVEEAAKVAKRKRITLLYPDPVKAVLKACHEFRHNRSSMLQDVLKKKPTEIDYMNGIIVAEGKKYKIATPVNETLCRLVKAIEQSYALRVVE
ncbi:MAG TPA: 2-dehydropantoate 2-reductase [Candidatus Bathyarchaeia archaeon]|nr:2-dehydropantoate 2-reductase [Candidatus Bathyarchaeia archaeon]